MATREAHFGESTGDSSTTSSSDQDKVTLTYTPTASTDYILFWRALGHHAASTSDFRIKFANTTTAVTHGSIAIEMQDLTDVYCVGGIAKETIGGSPVSTTYKVQYSAEASTAHILQARIMTLVKGANDQYAEVNGSSSTSSATPQDKTTLTWTPAAGDYIIIASSEISGASTSGTISCMLDIDGTDYSVMDTRVSDTTTRLSWCAVKRVTLTNASHTIKIQYAGDGSNNCTIQNARIAVFSAADFAANYYAEDTGADTRTGVGSDAYGDGASLTQTPVLADHVILASALFGEDSATDSAYCQFLKGATNYGESIREPNVGTLTLPFMYFDFRFEELAAASTTWKFQYKTEDTAQVVTIDEQVISVIQTEETSVTPIVGGPFQVPDLGFIANYGGQGFIDPTIQKLH